PPGTGPVSPLPPSRRQADDRRRGGGPEPAPWPGAGAGGHLRQRKIHPRPAAGGGRTPRSRPGAAARPRFQRPVRTPPPATAPPRAPGAPGPAELLRPTLERRADPARSGQDCPNAADPGRTGRTGPPTRRTAAAQPTIALRRAAPAPGHRAGTGRSTERADPG